MAAHWQASVDTYVAPTSALERVIAKVWAEVLAVGNHVRAVETGDRVLFSPDDRHEVEIAGEEFLLLRERDIHAVAAERNDANTGLYL